MCNADWKLMCKRIKNECVKECQMNIQKVWEWICKELRMNM